MKHCGIKFIGTRKQYGCSVHIGKKLWYKKVMKKCCFPNCENNAEEVHHICPLNRGGIDKIINYFPVCWHHHHKTKSHSNWRDKSIELLTWKYLKELELFNFNSNDYPEDEFIAKVNAKLTELTT